MEVSCLGEYEVRGCVLDRQSSHREGTTGQYLIRTNCPAETEESAWGQHTGSRATLKSMHLKWEDLRVARDPQGVCLFAQSTHVK